MVDTKAIFNRMNELDIKQEYLADKLKLSQGTLSLKLNNKRAFTIEEMFITADILKLNPEEIREYFFNQNVA